MNSIHDAQMPDGWHVIKTALLCEMSTAATFALCVDIANALWHARIIGESIARESMQYPCAEKGAEAPTEGQMLGGDLYSGGRFTF